MCMKNRIKELRSARGITQEKLAELCDTSTPQIQRLESGNRQLNNKWIERISAALNVAPHDLFASGTNEKKEQLWAAYQRKTAEEQRALETLLGIKDE